MRSMSRMKIFLVTFSVRHVRPLTTSPVVFPGVAFTEMISSGPGTHESGEKLQSESPAIDEPIRVDACEEASKVLIVYAWRGKGVKICVLEEFDEVEDISFGQVVGKRLR